MSLVRKIQAALTPDLLLPEYRREGAHRFAGHCYVASEAIYHLHAKREGYKARRMRVAGVTHWWLEHPETGHRIDATARQFPFKLDYSKGRFAGFLTRAPSARARKLMARVR